MDACATLKRALQGRVCDPPVDTGRFKTFPYEPYINWNKIMCGLGLACPASGGGSDPHA